MANPILVRAKTLHRPTENPHIRDIGDFLLMAYIFIAIGTGLTWPIWLLVWVVSAFS